MAATFSLQKIGAIGAPLAGAHNAVARDLPRRAPKTLGRRLARVGVIDSPLGRLLVAHSRGGLVAISFLNDGKAARDVIRALRRKFDLLEDGTGVRRIGDQIRRFLGGDTAALRCEVDLALVAGKFQRRVLSKLREVPAGAVITYRALAAAAGVPKAQRAVGTAMASNPVPIYVPCHRVVRSDGSVGNYAGGADIKVRLLRAEGFEVGADFRISGRTVLGHRGVGVFCRPECSRVARWDRTRMLIFADSHHARKAGMTACQVCHPDRFGAAMPKSELARA